MKISIPSLYAEYGRYTDELRMIPYFQDCLKPVERRVLYSVHQIARSSTKKSAKVVGDCIGSYHPHGDKSTYDTLVALVHRGYVEKQGNFGMISLDAIRAAAYRYTEVKANPFVDSFAFDLIEFVEWGDPENLGDKQPLYLGTPVPLGLIGEGIISGISFNTTKIPRFTLPDLLDRLSYLFQKELDPNTPPVTILPNLPNFDIYEQSPGEFENILTTGEGTITIIPKMMVDSFGVHVYGKPPTGVSKWKDGAEKGYYKLIDLSSKSQFEALFQTPTEHAPDQQFVNNIYEFVTSRLKFKCNVIQKDSIVTTMSIDNLLLDSYNNWVELLKLKYIKDKTALLEKLFQLKVVAVIRDILNNHTISLQKVDNIVSIFSQYYKTNYPDITDENIRQTCNKQNIRTLIEHNIDSQSVQIKINEVDDILNDIVQFAYQKAMSYIQQS